jgi:hypothetical protein
MAEPEPRHDDLTTDPSVIELRYRYHRARRHARHRAREESRLAQYRFYVTLAVLIAIAIAFVVAAFHEIQKLFGL